jgi:hypothetical protein
MPIPVNVDNFVRAETNGMFAGLAAPAQGVNHWMHYREPTPLDQQTVIRMNRDTLYSAAIVDISKGATFTLPDGDDRYVSAMVVNQDHYVNRVYHQPGEHELTTEEFDTPWVVLATRILVDPTDPKDVATVNALQDQLKVEANSAEPFAMPDYETKSFDGTRQAVLELAKHQEEFDNAAGKRGEVDEVKHLLVTAAGWGALPDSEARYIPVLPDKPVGQYSLTIANVPVDGFWSVSVYNEDGFFEPNDRNAYSVNNLTATKNDDGSVTVHFGGDDDRPNLIPITEGWNYLVRLYRPRPEARHGGSFTLPSIEPA